MRLDILICVECSGNIELQNDSYRCLDCKKTFTNNDGVGIFFREDNQLFSNSDYENINKLSSPQKKYISLFNTVKKFVKFSVNKSFDESIKKIIGSYEQNDMDILIIGCGNQVEEFKKSYSREGLDLNIIGMDVDINADVNIFADAHNLPFKDSSFDFIIITAVLEHVLFPHIVVDEIHRTLKTEGNVYSEVPFMQQVHEGAYDFSRFSRVGHVALFNKFEIINSGIVAGIGTAFVWSIRYLLDSLLSPLKLNFMTKLLIIFFQPIKILDYLLPDQYQEDFCSCTFVVGSKPKPNFKNNFQNVLALYKGGKITLHK